MRRRADLHGMKVHLIFKWSLNENDGLLRGTYQWTRAAVHNAEGYLGADPEKTLTAPTSSLIKEGNVREGQLTFKTPAQLC